MIELLSPRSQDAMRRAGLAAASTLAHVGAALRSGMSTHAIDELVRVHTAALGGKPSQLGYNGFPAAVCTWWGVGVGVGVVIDLVGGRGRGSDSDSGSLG